MRVVVILALAASVALILALTTDSDWPASWHSRATCH